MNTIQEMTDNLYKIKEKIIKTDEVLKLLGDKSKDLSKVEKKYSKLLVKYAEKNEEIQLWMEQCKNIEKQLSICNTTHLPLQNDLTVLKTRYESLEQTHNVYVNAAEIKYQSSCQQVLQLSKNVEKLTKKIEHLEAKETYQFGNVKKLKNALRVANVKLNANVLKYEELIANNNKTIAELEEQYKHLETQRNTDLIHLAQIQEKCEQLKKTIQKKSSSEEDSKPAELQEQVENFQRELKCSTDELKILKFSHENDIKEITKKYELENKLLNNKLAELKLEKLVKDSASQTDIDDCYNCAEILSEMITVPELLSPCSPNQVDVEIPPKFKDTSTQTDQIFRQLKEHSQSGPFRINENTIPDSRPDKQRTVFRTVNKVRKSYKTTINKLLKHVKNRTLNTKRILDDVLAASSPIVIVSPRILKSYLNDNTGVTNPKLLCHKNGDDHSHRYLKMNNKITCFHYRKHRNQYYCCLTCCNDCKLNSNRYKHENECCGARLQSKHLNCCTFACNHNNDCNCCSRNNDNQKEVNCHSRDYHRNINCSYFSDDDHKLKLHLNRDLHLNNSPSYAINKNQTQPFDSAYMKHRNINDHLKETHFHYDANNKIKSSASSISMCNNHDCSSKMDATAHNCINGTITSPNLDNNKCYCIECTQQIKENSCNKHSKIHIVASCSNNNHKEKTTSLYNIQCSSCDDNHSDANYNNARINSCNIKQHKSFNSEINPVIPAFHHNLPSNKECYSNLLPSRKFKQSKYKNKVKQKRESAEKNTKSKKYRRILYSSSEEDNDQNTDIDNKESAESQTKLVKSVTETGIDVNVMLAKYLESLPLDQHLMGKALSDADSGIETLLIKTVKSPITTDVHAKPELIRTPKSPVIITTNTEEEDQTHFSSIETLSPDSTTKQKTNKHTTSQQVQVSEGFQVRGISVNETQNKAKVNKIKKDRTLESEIRESKSTKESLKKPVEENELESVRNKNSLETKTILKTNKNDHMHENRIKNTNPKVLSNKRNNTSANAADYKKKKLEVFGSDIESDTISEASELENEFIKTPDKRVAHKPKSRVIPNTSDQISNDKVSTNRKVTVEKLLLPKVSEMKQMFKRPQMGVQNSVVQSPDIVSSLKENIPLEKEKVEELDLKIGRKLVADIATLDWNKDLMETVVNCLAKQESSYVARLIVNQAAQDYSQQFDRTFTPPAPLMTITQRKLLVLMTQLERNGLNNIQQSFLNIAEQRLLSETKVEAVHPLTRLYVAICKLKYDIEQVRMLCCNAAYHMGDLLFPLMFIILTMWGDVLPMAQHSPDIHLATVLVHIIQSKSCKIPGYNLKNLRNLLNDYYGYKAGQTTTEDVFAKLVAAYSENCSKLVYISILILCKNQPSKWTYKQISTHFIPIITDNIKLANRSILVSMTFVLVSRLVETFDVKLDKDSIKGVHDWLCQFIRDNAVVSPELRKNIETCLSVFFRIFNT